MMQKLREIMLIILLLTLVVLLFWAGLVVKGLAAQVSHTLSSLEQASSELSLLVQDSRDYLALIRPDAGKSRLSIERNLQLGEAAIGTIRLLNTQTIPRLHKGLDSLDESARELSLLVAQTRTSLNLDLFPATTHFVNSLSESAEKFGMTASTLDAQLKEIAPLAARAGVTLDDIHSILSSQELKVILANTSHSSEELLIASSNLRAATDSAPQIAAAFEQMAKTSSRWQKALLLARIIGFLKPY